KQAFALLEARRGVIEKRRGLCVDVDRAAGGRHAIDLRGDAVGTVARVLRVQAAHVGDRGLRARRCTRLIAGVEPDLAARAHGRERIPVQGQHGEPIPPSTSWTVWPWTIL